MLDVSIHGAVEPDLLQIRVRCVQIPINVLAFLSENLHEFKVHTLVLSTTIVPSFILIFKLQASGIK